MSLQNRKDSPSYPEHVTPTLNLRQARVFLYSTIRLCSDYILRRDFSLGLAAVELEILQLLQP